MKKKHKKALITGITGQDGAYLAQFLLDKGYAVSGLLSRDYPHSMERLDRLGIRERVAIFRCSLTDHRQIGAVLKKVRPQEVYNLSALSSVGLSFQHPGATMHVNVMSVHNLLEAIRRTNKTIRFYQASSGEMFGNADRLPVNEGTPMRPVSPYAISKAAGHMLTQYYRESHKLFCCAGILFNHESVLRPDRFVTKKILSAAVRIYRGSRERLRLGNIDVKRDWGYAPEYVKVMWRMLQQASPDDYIIASGRAHSLRDFIRLVFKNLGLDWKKYVVIDKNLYRPADIAKIYGDASRAVEKLDWKYDLTFTELVQILVREELEWQAERQHSSK